MTDTRNHYDIDAIKRSAAGRWPDILRSLGGLSADQLNGRKQPCPRCDGHDRFRLLDVEAGALFCNQCFSEKNGDGIAALMWLKGWDFKTTLAQLVEYLGLNRRNGHARDSTSSDFDAQAELIPASDLQQDQHIQFLQWSRTKLPVTVDACLAAGVCQARWPRKLREPYHCIAFPAWRTETKPSGWILYRAEGTPFPAVEKYGLSERKTHMLRGSKDGWVFVGGREALDRASTVIKCEGIPDALAVHPLLPDEYCVVTNICGCGGNAYWHGGNCPPMSVFKGKAVIGIGDADRPGVSGVTAFAESAARHAVSAKIADLPYDVVESHGRDLRDWVAEGNGWTELEQMLGAATCAAPAENRNARVAEPRNVDTGTTVGDREGKKSQATELVELALSAGVDLFHSGSEPYARLPVESHHEVWRIGSKGFRDWLRRAYWQANAAVPGSQATQDAIGVLTGKALFDGKSLPVAVRIGWDDGVIYLDLADAEWRAVAITKDGWQVVTDSPVRFVRPNGLQELPAPESGGTVDELRELVNVPNDDDWILLLSWLVAAFRPRGPYPVLCIHGEQGSAKSTLCRFVRALVDPNRAALRSTPKEPRDLMIAASNAWCMGFDNLSTISEWLSDALCRLSTGGGFSTRALFSDAEEALFDAMRPILLNGIPELSTRPDLLDRTIVLNLPPVPESERKTETELQRRFEAARPRILGALLDAVSVALRNEAKVQLTELPRMADFAIWATAAESAFGCPPGTFMSAYTTNRATANESAIESSTIAEPLQRFAAGEYSWTEPEHALPPADKWCGSATELLETLSRVAGERVVNRKDWPKKPHVLSCELRRIAPNLRRIGISVEFVRNRCKRTITISGKPTAASGDLSLP